ncbi:hypothetical protein CEXT_45701 [Caerostris extrusa]|uniref:Uncharacterized protein n=1 Tax=Caerostris extrusa TaxID=172846 RepID=A0AAV4MWJ4_CAEEX|nr:hypothetical protein CEXT_45701 [Caerostris extrusa]
MRKRRIFQVGTRKQAVLSLILTKLSVNREETETRTVLTTSAPLFMGTGCLNTKVAVIDSSISQFLFIFTKNVSSRNRVFLNSAVLILESHRLVTCTCAEILYYLKQQLL